MLQSIWMLLASWLIFGYIFSYSLSGKIITSLFLDYRPYYSTIAEYQRYWFNNTYWVISFMLYYGLCIFLSIFFMGIINIVIPIRSDISWYIAYIALFASIYLKNEPWHTINNNSSYLNAVKKINTLLEIKGFTFDIDSMNMGRPQKSDHASSQTPSTVSNKPVSNKPVSNKPVSNKPSGYQKSAKQFKPENTKHGVNNSADEAAKPPID